MNPIQKAISGHDNLNENILLDEQIYKALEEFYRAFNTKDFTLMEANWLHSKEIAMDNPLGGIKRGWSEIKTVYERIFSGKADVFVEFYDYTVVTFDGGFCAIGRERGYVKVEDTKLDLAIRTSRIYKLVNGNYKQVHHHGSIENPTLLEQYQNLMK